MTLERLPFEKPRRLRDKQALRDFHRSHPHCAIIGCRFRSSGPHHIKPRSLGGGDFPENLAPLCTLHHTGPQGPHQLGHREWFARFEGQLPDDTRAKFAAVWGED